MGTGLIVAVILFCVLGIIPKKYRASSTPWIGFAIVLFIISAVYHTYAGENDSPTFDSILGWIFSVYMISDFLPLFLPYSKNERAKKYSPNIHISSSFSSKLEDVDKMNGAEFEGWCASLLLTNGFEKISVTPGSGDQGVDILAEQNGLKYAFQCKRYNSRLGNKPIQEVNTGKTIYGCSRAVVMTNNYFTKGAVEAASAVGVELWDRDKLISMLDRPYKRGRNNKQKNSSEELSITDSGIDQ